MQASIPPSGPSLLLPASGQSLQRPTPFSALVALRSTPLSIRRAISKSTSHKGFSIDMLCQKLLQPPPNIEKVSTITESIESEVVDRRIAEIRRMLCERMGVGEISVSPYDTAWVAFIRDVDGGNAPRFPLSLRWIAEHQLPDGSWGDRDLFEVHDRVMNTLACVLALRSYQVYAHQCAGGMIFLRENMHLIGERDEECMPIGFEIAFPSLANMARALGLDLPFHSPGLQKIYKMRTLKMERIPKDLMHEVPNTLLHSLEGMATGECCDSNDLDWTRLLRLRCTNGSFLFSPSSTAFAVMQTGDSKSLRYLQDVTERFGGGVPNVYPIDMFEHMWTVDRLERLGIARYFEPEIEQCLDYVYNNWTEDGIGWASGSPVQDIDDTAMGFRLLRLHGYDVSPDVFHNFRREGEFQCFVGQSSQAVSGIFNLYRAAHVAFVGEDILDQARRFSRMFLSKKQSTNQLIDKWIITKDLPGEVAYALDFPWHASLPRVEARTYLEQYGGEEDVWIGKTLYRMPLINNNSYLELAKADFNMCQRVHQREWLGLRRWLDELGLGEHGVSCWWLTEAFFLASSGVFEPEKSAQRLGWTRTAVLTEAVRRLLRLYPHADETKRDIVLRLRKGSSNVTASNGSTEGTCDRTSVGALVRVLHSTIQNISRKAVAAAPAPQPIAIVLQRCRQHLQQAWEEWILTVDEEGDGEALLLCRTLELCAGRFELEEALSSAENIRHGTTTNGNTPWNRKQKYRQAAALTTAICHGLRQLRHEDDATKCKTSGSENEHDIYPLEMEMKELLQCAIQSINGGGSETMQTFLTIAKSFFYVAYCRNESMVFHISKVLFERVE